MKSPGGVPTVSDNTFITNGEGKLKHEEIVDCLVRMSYTVLDFKSDVCIS